MDTQELRFAFVKEIAYTHPIVTFRMFAKWSPKWKVVEKYVIIKNKVRRR
jgi:hypothetical protein